MGGGEPGSQTAENVKRWEAMEEPPRQTIAEKLAAVKTYFKGGWKTVIFGDYDYSYLCMPDFCPWKKGGRPVSAPFLDTAWRVALFLYL